LTRKNPLKTLAGHINSCYTMLSFGFIQRNIAARGSVKQPSQMSLMFIKGRLSDTYVFYWVTYVTDLQSTYTRILLSFHASTTIRETGRAL